LLQHRRYICATSKLHEENKDVKSVVIFVAQRCARRVQNISNPDSRADVVNVDGSVQSERVASLVGSVNVVHTRRVFVLPDAEVAVNEAVVQPKDRVGWRCPGVGHDSSNTVMSPRVRGTFGAAGHVSVGALVVASINHALICVCSRRVIVVAGEAVKVVVLAGTNIDS
jgi:hypothetical protein